MSYSKTLRDVAAAEAGDAKAGKRLSIDADTVAQGGHSSGPIAAWNHRQHVETLAARLRTAVRAHRAVAGDDVEGRTQAAVDVRMAAMTRSRAYLATRSAVRAALWGGLSLAVIIGADAVGRALTGN